MIRIGLIGEDPNDTKAIEQLMKQKFDKGFYYRTLSKNKRGSKMFTETAVRSYNLELATSTFNYIVVIVDADAIIIEESKLHEKKNLYERLEKQLNCKSLLLLNIYELEALILADISGLKDYYQTNISFKGSVSHQQKPKEFLQQKTGKKYKVSDCPDLFKLLNFDTIVKNCAYFKTFITDFENAIAN